MKAAVTVITLGVVYLAMSLTLTCGCALQIGSSPCREYVHAVEQRLTECGFWDDWYRSQVQRVAAQCDDSGPLGITITEQEDVSDCVAEVMATSCERIQHGAPTCLGAVRL